MAKEMRKTGLTIIAGLGLLIALSISCQRANENTTKVEETTDMLPSWNEGEAKKRIIAFVQQATDSTSEGYIPPAERIAVFDNDGTLWNEYPMLFQANFSNDRIKRLAKQHPEWKTQQPFKAILEGDREVMKTFKPEDFSTLMAASHTGISTEEFMVAARQWFDTAEHPLLKRPYTQCVYQPQLELLHYLHLHGFKNYIVSGGGVDFIRAFAEKTYGIPPEQIIGTSGRTEVNMINGEPVLEKLPQLRSFDDRAEKVVNIDLHIGRRPVLACGNSDGDLAMLQYTAARKGPHLAIYIHHDDAQRESAYQKHPLMGELKEGLAEAKAKNWILVSMQNDWNVVFPEK